MTAKDIVLAIIARIGTGGGIGSVIEFRGAAIRALSVEGRMTVCNMSIEAGARAGMIAPDDTTFAYLEDKQFAPKGADWERALDAWRALVTDDDATFDKEVVIDAATLLPHVSWGTNPGHTVAIDDRVPDPASYADAGAREVGAARARVHGFAGRHTDARHRCRHGVHRVVYQLAHRGSARRGRRRARPQGQAGRAHARGARAPPRSRRRPRRRGSIGCSSPPASTGGSRAVRCALR